MPSKAFLAYQDKIPTAPPSSMEGPGMPGAGPAPAGAPIPAEFAVVHALWQAGKLSGRKAAKTLGVSPRTFGRWAAELTENS